MPRNLQPCALWSANENGLPSTANRRKEELAQAIFQLRVKCRESHGFLFSVLVKTVEDLQRRIRELKDKLGKAILITDHNVQQTLAVCDRGIITEGKVLAQGDAARADQQPHRAAGVSWPHVQGGRKFG